MAAGGSAAGPGGGILGEGIRDTHCCQRKRRLCNTDAAGFLKLLSKWVQRIYPAVQGLWKKNTGRQDSWRPAKSEERGGLCVGVHSWALHTHVGMMWGQWAPHISWFSTTVHVHVVGKCQAMQARLGTLPWLFLQLSCWEVGSVPAPLPSLTQAMRFFEFVEEYEL